MTRDSKGRFGPEPRDSRGRFAPTPPVDELRPAQEAGQKPKETNGAKGAKADGTPTKEEFEAWANDSLKDYPKDIAYYNDHWEEIEQEKLDRQHGARAADLKMDHLPPASPPAAEKKGKGK